MLHRHAAHGEAVARIGWCVDRARPRRHHRRGRRRQDRRRPRRAAALDPSRHTIIYLPQPRPSGSAASSTTSSPPSGRSPASTPRTLVPQAADALAAEHAERGRTPVLVIDEAHLLDNAQLEAIRMLTNHDMDSGSPFAACSSANPPCGNA